MRTGSYGALNRLGDIIYLYILSLVTWYLGNLVCTRDRNAASPRKTLMENALFLKSLIVSEMIQVLKCIRPQVAVFWSVFSECPKLHDFFITSIKNACYNIAQTIQNTHSPWKRSTPVRNASFSDHFHWFSVPESIKFTVNFDDFNFEGDFGLCWGGFSEIWDLEHLNWTK